MEKTAEWELLVSESSAMEKTEKIQLPHNYEAILKDADSPVDISSMDKLLSQLHDGKYWVDQRSLAKIASCCLQEIPQSFRLKTTVTGTGHTEKKQPVMFSLKLPSFYKCVG